MRSILLLCGLFLSVTLPGQIQTGFDFPPDSNWLEDPAGRWGLDSLKPLSGKYSLWHSYDNPDAGNDRISYPLTNLQPDSGAFSCRFRIRHGYSPSSSNKWGVFVFADRDAREMKTGGAINGYVIGVNYSGSDDLLKLWKVNSGTAVVLIQTNLNWQEQVGTVNSPALAINRLPGGKWTVLADTSAGLEGYDTLGTAQDASFSQAAYTGISFSYSSTKDRLLWLDDFSIEGIFLADTLAPVLLAVQLVSRNILQLEFSEAVNPFGALFRLGTLQELPDSISTSGNTCNLFFSRGFAPDEEMELSFSGVQDLSGNSCIPGTARFICHQPKTGDVVVNEIMADPTPVVGLPDAEYLELYNTSSHEVNLTGWQLSVGSSHWLLPSILLEPFEFLVITSSAAASLFGSNIKVCGLISSSGSLGNTGASVTLTDEGGKLISAIDYEDSWYADAAKKNGGWSLECIDPARPCLGAVNWKASMSAIGGTPGLPNSVLGELMDSLAPLPERVAPLNDSTLLLVFNETPDSSSACNTGFYFVENGPGQPLYIWQGKGFGREFYIGLAQKLERGEAYELLIRPGIKDCSGNACSRETSLALALADDADSLDLLFSEILYDVPSGSTEFIEVYNASSKVIELQGMELAILRTGTEEIQSRASLSHEPRLLFPGAYAAFTGSPEKLANHYFLKDPGSVVMLESMPLLSNEGGCAVLLTPGFRQIDKACWNDAMHHSLLANTQGISLERTSFSGSSLEWFNWHSAASLAGWATPGYENSQESQTGISDGKVRVVPELITPDNDGRDDYAEILFHMSDPGWIAHVQIYDLAGRLVRALLNNQLTGTEGRLTWDGTDSRGVMCYNGIYIVRISLFNAQGGTYESRKVCVISIR